MNKLLVLLPVLGILLSGQCAQATKTNSQSGSSNCQALPWNAPKTTWDVGQDLPKFVDRNKLVAALRPANPPYDPPKSAKEEKAFSDGDAILGIGIKPWIYVPGTFIAVMETEKREPTPAGGYKSCEHALDIGLLKQVGDGFTVLARTEQPIKLDKHFSFNQFDLAPYKLSERELAFGLQQAHIESHTGGGAPTASLAMLDLYRNNNSKIEKVLSTPIIYEQQAANHVEVARVSVSPEKTDGYYNLAKTYKGKRCYFIWQKDKYNLTGQDTFANYVKGQGIDL